MDRILARLPSKGVKLDVMNGAAFDRRRPRYLKASFAQTDTIVIEVDESERKRLESFGAALFDDVQFQVLPGWDDDAVDENNPMDVWGAMPPNPSDGSLSDVLDQIGAPKAWETTRGRGVTIAVVDTGVAEGLREIEAARRSPIDLETTFYGQHWQDTQGHGSMCAAIAAGSRRFGGCYDGVAPEATVISARSSLRSTDLFDIFDELVLAKTEGRLQGPVVISNSYGLYVCSPPRVLPQDHPFFSAVLTAIDNGMFVCFAAGNNHYDGQCRHDPTACGPNSIWGPNSHDRVVSVGTINRELTNCDPLTPHANSSRGPGEWANEWRKPDCVAPTYGEVPWGERYRRMKWWGTSGACPQVAGLAALILSAAPGLGPDKVAHVIRDTCCSLPQAKTCVGRGLIDCGAAVASLGGAT